MASAEVSVTEDKQTAVDVVFVAGFIEAQAMATETEPSNDGGVRWDITDSTGETDTSYGPTRRILVEAGRGHGHGQPRHRDRDACRSSSRPAPRSPSTSCSAPASSCSAANGARKRPTSTTAFAGT